jgi:integrase
VRLPTVLTEGEVRRLLEALSGSARLMAALLYGAGLRQIECLTLRVKDIDFAYRQIIVRDGKGARDRATMLPENLVQPLHSHLGKVRLLHRGDRREGCGEVWLPHALSRKYPRAGYEWGWQFVFPSGKRSLDPSSSARAVKRAARAAAMVKPVSCHTLRHAPTRARLRHPHGAGAARAFRRVDHHGLHARHEQGRTRGTEPAGPA